MHIVLAVLGVIGAGAFWWYRMRYLGTAAGEVVDAAERARGAFRRHRFRKKVEASNIDAISDPSTAAAVLLVALASVSGRMSEAQEAAITNALRTTMGVTNPSEELIFAKWAAADVVDVNNLIGRLARVWTANLTLEERQLLYGLAKKIISMEAEPDDIVMSALQRLQARLDIAPRPAA